MIGEFSLGFRSVLRVVHQTSVHITCTKRSHLRKKREFPKVDNRHHTNPVMDFVLRKLIISNSIHLCTF
jgi:hypothetical protein